MFASPSVSDFRFISGFFGVIQGGSTMLSDAPARALGGRVQNPTPALAPVNARHPLAMGVMVMEATKGMWRSTSA
jgi:hypothetical protein